jgi:hypothetical protein
VSEHKRSPISEVMEYSTLHRSPRESLLAALSLATVPENAAAILDALDTYLAEPEVAGRELALRDDTPHPSVVIARVEAERDAAIERATNAEAELARLRKNLGESDHE